MSYLCVIRSVKKMDGFYSNLNAQIRDDSIQTVHDHFPAMTCYWTFAMDYYIDGRLLYAHRVTLSIQSVN